DKIVRSEERVEEASLKPHETHTLIGFVPFERRSIFHLDASVRKAVFEVLDDKFDHHLAQSTSHLNHLYAALHDEDFEIQCLVLSTLGRLAEINPACVQPNLRKMLFQVISMLDCSGSASRKDEAALFLAHLISASPRFFIQYAQPLVYIIIPKIHSILPVTLRVHLMLSSVKVLSRLNELELNNNDERYKFKPSTMMNVAMISSHLSLQASCDAVKAIEKANFRLTHQQQQRANYSANEYRFKPHFLPLADPATNRSFLPDGTPVEKSNQQLSSLGRVNSDKVHFLKQAVALAKQAASSAFTQLFQRLASVDDRIDASLWPHLKQTIDERSDQSAFVNYLLEASNVSNLTRIDKQIAITGSCIGSNSDLKAGEMTQGLSSAALSEPWAESTSVVVSYFVILGHLANVAPKALLPYVNDLLPLLNFMLQDSTCFQKRFVSVIAILLNLAQIAVWTLGMLVTNLGFVVIPFKLEPSLLGILLGMLLKEESRMLRKEVIKLLGLIGAVDPFRLKIFTGQIDCVVECEQWELLVSLAQENEAEFCSISVLFTLVQLLGDPSIQGQQHRVVQTMIYVLLSLESRAPSFLKMFLPQYLSCLRKTKDLNLQELMLRHLASLLNLIKIYVKEYALEITELLASLWTLSFSGKVQSACIRLMSSLNVALVSEFYPCLEILLPNMVRTLEQEKDPEIVIQLLKTIPSFGYNLENFVPIVLTPIVRLVTVKSEMELLELVDSIDPKSAKNQNSQKKFVEFDLRLHAIVCLNQLSQKVDVSSMLGRIVHPICRLLNLLNSCCKFYREQAVSLVSKQQVSECVRLEQACLEALKEVGTQSDILFGTLHKQLYNSFDIFVPLIEPVKKKVAKTLQQKCIISKGGESPFLKESTPTPEGSHDPSELLEMPDYSRIKKYEFNGENLSRAWKMPELPSREDWTQWLRTLGATMLKESVNLTLRVVSHQLSGISPIVQKNLFNAAFLTCFSHLTEQQQDSLLRTLEKVLMETDQPVEVSQTILNLEEFLDHVDKYSQKKRRFQLPLSSTILVDRAKYNRSYAKALYYLERQIVSEGGAQSPSPALLEALLIINNKLNLKEASRGVLLQAT
ncbi:hypothetical protein Ciccas_011484, partial [Cichlidogyrus casuarinus]